VAAGARTLISERAEYSGGFGNGRSRRSTDYRFAEAMGAQDRL
jgi:hypothetical protein